MQNANAVSRQVPGVVSHQVHGTASAVAVAAGLATRDIFFAFDPYPNGYYQFTVKDESDNGAFLASLLPPGREYKVLLTNQLGPSSDVVMAMSVGHALLQAVERRHLRENGVLGGGQPREDDGDEPVEYAYQVTSADGTTKRGIYLDE